MTTTLLPYQQADLDRYYATTNVTGQTVLEITGVEPELLSPWIEAAGAASVTTIIPSSSVLYLPSDSGNLPWWYAELDTLVTVSDTIFSFADNTFDSSIASGLLSRINNLPNFLAEVYRVLKPNGILYISGEPYWSRKFGSNYNFNHLDIHYHYRDNPILLDWEHLYSSKEEIRTRLTDLYSTEIIDKVLESTFDSPRINRKFLDELTADLNNSMFTVEADIEQRMFNNEMPADIYELIKVKHPNFSNATTISNFILRKGT